MDRTVGTYALCHFAVDFCCIAALLGLVVPALGGSDLLAAGTAVVAYDMFAFALQMPIGAALDGREAGARSAMTSYGLVLAGCMCAYLPLALFPYISVALIAAGNALFHCAGGVDVLRISDGKAAPSGVFIAPGAFGVFFGSQAVEIFGPMLRGVMIALMLLCALGTVSLIPDAYGRDARLPVHVPVPSRNALAAIILLAVTVALRSYTGMVMAFPWKTVPALAFASVAGVVAGKAAGGFIADTIGLDRASIISLGVSAPLFLFAHAFPAAGILATFLFNFTMPITLISLAELLPQNRGFAFGIASFALAIGAFPSFMGLRAESGTALAILSLASLACLLAAFACARRSSDG